MLFRNTVRMMKGKQIKKSILSICMPYAVTLILVAIVGCSDSLEEAESYLPVVNSYLNGGWLINLGMGESFDGHYMIGDGRGGIDEHSFGGSEEPPGSYQAFSDGTFTAILNTADSEVILNGQLTSSTEGTVVYSNSIKSENSNFVMIADPSACQGAWRGTLRTTDGSTIIYSIEFSINEFGQVSSTFFEGFTKPVTGRMISESGKIVALFTTGEDSPYDQIRFNGDLVEDDLNNGVFYSVNSVTNGSVELTRKGEVGIKTHYKEDAERLTAFFVTNKGDFQVELYAKECPETVWNFVNLAEGRQLTEREGNFYDGLIFHRVIDGFMIQGGCPNGDGTGDPGYQFKDEFDPDLRHDSEGILSMANSGANTNGSQFFITLDAEPHLDDVHTVFGRVTEGMDVVKAIGSVAADAYDKPLEDVVINSIKIARKY